MAVVELAAGGGDVAVPTTYFATVSKPGDNGSANDRAVFDDHEDLFQGGDVFKRI